MAEVRRRCGYSHGIDVSARGRSEGLSIGWKEQVSVKLLSFSVRHIDVEIDDVDRGFKWRLTGFYGAPEERNRAGAWDLLRHLSALNNLPWVVLGDFNEILYPFEKE
ncbi:hypothetical protein HRI_004279000 [Hibiscus trionum]|uniref:Endonuclease/exonuclease/phosphatase domain-containing protein n=1 Tax=Hibiscus trionum TaxID=183268 RepID=A0A9W7MIU0_HIBTR|nr:hypothetical protein HRI_004279000 [Hibiscus trionum]